MDRFITELKKLGKTDDAIIQKTYSKYQFLDIIIFNFLADICIQKYELTYNQGFSQFDIEVMKKKIKKKPMMFIIDQDMIIYFWDKSFTVYNARNNIVRMCSEISHYTKRKWEIPACPRKDLCIAWDYMMIYLLCYYQNDPKKIEERIIKDKEIVAEGFIMYIDQLVDDKGMKNLLNKYYHVNRALLTTNYLNSLKIKDVRSMLEINPKKADEELDMLISKNLDIFTVYDEYKNYSMYVLFAITNEGDNKFFTSNKNKVFTSIKDFLKSYPNKNILNKYLQYLPWFEDSLKDEDKKTLGI